jgi:hypothetical protein
MMARKVWKTPDGLSCYTGLSFVMMEFFASLTRECNKKIMIITVYDKKKIH